MELTEFDSFVQMINEMSEVKEAATPLQQLSSEELALIKSFDPELLEEISNGKLAPSEALLLARSATSNQEQEHVIKENDKECADSVLHDVFEAVENRLEKNRQEAVKLKEEADQDAEEDEISDEEWQNALDSKYEEIYNDDKIEINIADKVDVSDPKKILNNENYGSDRIYEVMDNDIPCAFWDDEDWVEQGLLIKVNGYGDFIKDDNTVWAYCAVLEEVKKRSFNPDDPLDDVNDYNESDEIITEEELFYIPELKGKVGKIWQGEPVNDINEAFAQALDESYAHEDCEIVVRDSLNRQWFLTEEEIVNEGGEAIKFAGKLTKAAGKAIEPLEKGVAKINNAVKAHQRARNISKIKKAGEISKTGKVAKDVAKVGAGAAGAKGIGNWLSNKIDQGVDAIKNTMDSLANQGSEITDTKGKIDNLDGSFNTDRI